MKNYFSIEGKLYTLTNKQKKELEKLFPNAGERGYESQWSDYLEWIETNGKYISTCQNLAY